MMLKVLTHFCLHCNVKFTPGSNAWLVHKKIINFYTKKGKLWTGRATIILLMGKCYKNNFLLFM